MKDSDIIKKQGGIRNVAGKTFPLLVSIFVLRNIKDTQCGFKMFRKSLIKEVFSKQRLQGWAFDAELLFIAKKKGYKIKEIGIKWRNDEDTKLSLVKDSIKMALDVLKIRYNDLMDRY